MVECVFCQQQFPDTQILCQHLLYTHYGVEIAERRLRTNKKKNVHCWCGGWFSLGFRFDGMADFGDGKRAQHIERRGGLAAHILEITLGVKHK